jgi:hypothetical protein
MSIRTEIPIKAVLLSSTLLLGACASQPPAQPDLDAALTRHLASIQNRDLAEFAATLTQDDTLYMIFPNGEALLTPAQAVDWHRGWFTNPDWVWEGEILRKMVGTDMATVLMKYHYRDAPEGEPRSFWFVLVFELEGGEWRLIHDQNTRIPAPAPTD